MSKVDRTDIKEQIAASIKNFASAAKDETARERLVIEMPEFIQRKAALISAHFLLPAGSRIVDMACETGEVTYALALLNPRTEIIGIDRDAKSIEFARKNYRLPNLSFRQTDIGIPDLEDDSVDGIINSNVLHRVYSHWGYNADEVFNLLEKQIRKLKVGGTMLIRDYMLPADDEFVLMELPNLPSRGMDPRSLSDADLLVQFSQTSRPMADGCEGFFIEEMMPRREGTRLFRLMHKWALEFIHRKNSRSNWEQELREEYTFATYQDFRREFARLGMRMVFSAPYWNPWVVKNCFKGRFQMYTQDYVPMGNPATNYFIIAQKVADKQSLVLEERRPSQKPVGDLQIMIVRDKNSGQLHELVKRPGEYCDVVPYRITPDNRLVVYVRSGYPRPIVNAVHRGSYNIDGKKWSGHLIEPITMDTVNMTDDIEENRKMIFDYVRGYASLRPKTDESWYVGDTYFPSPDRIDEAIEPVFVEVENPQKTSWPIQKDSEVNFTEIGTITELEATDILLAAQVGLLPEPRLELHVFELMSRYQMTLPRWVGAQLPETTDAREKGRDAEEMLEDVQPAEFEEEKKGAITLKPVKSVFVEEGKVGRGTRGLSAQDIEFIVTEDGIENIAVVIPLTRDWDDNLLVALEPKILPVPNRLGGDGAMLNAPSFVLPKNVRSVEDAKLFIANKFGVPTEQVGQLGESYFTHTGVTPQRVYPFVVSSPARVGAGPRWSYTPLKYLWRVSFFGRFSGPLLQAIARLHMSLERGQGLQLSRDPVNLKSKGFSLSTEKVAVEAKNVGYSAVPSRVLGQRGGAGAAGIGVAVKPQEPVWTPESDPEILEQSKAAQALIESIAAPRVGPRLSDSYAQAKRVLRESTANIQMNETVTVAEIDKDIEEVARHLKKLDIPPVTAAPAVAPVTAAPAPMAPAPLAPTPTPPRGGGDPTGKGRR
ncbi:MAG: class I SAM-dependent methyltransferase [Bdellovibrionales bacterium]|nr:class I SAM-dependent methyltransferase [Bdellovibrionales bacterium]